MKCNFISFVIERSDPGIEPENSTSQPLTINPTPVPANPLAELTETEPLKSGRKPQKTVENFANRTEDQNKRKLTSTNAQTMVLVEKKAARGKSSPAVTKYSFKKAV